ncbi:hypothetical protein BGX21_002415, partial [Mortierella sp. AD011]
MSFSVPGNVMFFVPRVGVVTFINVFDVNAQSTLYHPQTNQLVISTTIPQDVPRGVWTRGPWPHTSVTPGESGQGEDAQRGDGRGGNSQGGDGQDGNEQGEPGAGGHRFTRFTISAISTHQIYMLKNVDGFVQVWTALNKKSNITERNPLLDGRNPVPFPACLTEVICSRELTFL